MTELSPTPESLQVNKQFCSQLFYFARNALLSPHAKDFIDGDMEYRVQAGTTRLQISNHLDFLLEQPAGDNFRARTEALHKGSVWLALSDLGPTDSPKQQPTEYILGRLADLTGGFTANLIRTHTERDYQNTGLSLPSPHQPIIYKTAAQQALLNAPRVPFLQTAHRRISGLKNRIHPAA